MKARISPPDAARRRSLIALSSIIVGFAGVVYATGALLPEVDDDPRRWLLAAGPIALLAAWAWEFFRMVRDDDEMMRGYHLRVISISGMIVLIGGTMWGTLERLLAVPHLPAFLLLPGYAIVSALVMAFGVRHP